MDFSVGLVTQGQVEAAGELADDQVGQGHRGDEQDLAGGVQLGREEESLHGVGSQVELRRHVGEQASSDPQRPPSGQPRWGIPAGDPEEVRYVLKGEPEGDERDDPRCGVPARRNAEIEPLVL